MGIRKMNRRVMTRKILNIRTNPCSRYFKRYSGTEMKCFSAGPNMERKVRDIKRTSNAIHDFLGRPIHICLIKRWKRYSANPVAKVNVTSLEFEGSGV